MLHVLNVGRECGLLLRSDNMSTDGDDSEAVQQLREQRPNVANTEQLLQLLEKTRPRPREWIVTQHPSITEIMRHYPRFQDMPNAVNIMAF